MKDFSYKTTAVALQGRRLVTVSRKGGTWRAAISETGHYYLDHGTYPDSPQPAKTRAAPASPVPAPRVPRQPARAAPGAAAAGSGGCTEAEQAEDLVRQVVQAGGRLEVGQAGDGTDYDRLITAARLAPSLPFGRKLRVRGAGPWSARRREVFLDEDFAAQIPARPVPVPQRVACWHPVIAAYRGAPDGHEVSGGALGRASRILQALAAEAEQRSYLVKPPVMDANPYGGAARGRLTAGQLRIAIGEFSYRLRLRERPGPGGEALPYGRVRDKLPGWQRVRQTRFIPTGELRLTVEDGYSHDGRQAEFRDTRTASLEDRLPAVLRELEIRAAEDDWRRRQQQLEAEEKHRRWEHAIDQARHDFRQAQLASALHAQARDWQLSQTLDAYLDQLEARIPALPPSQRPVAAEWLTWARQYRHTIDPLRGPIAAPQVPGPAPGDLEPFLHGWSPYGPST